MDDADWRFAIDELKGKMKARDERIARLLKMALEAAQADPPFLPCVTSQLEEVIDIMNKPLK